MVVVPGIDGELGILPHHTRLISALGIGELRIKKGGTEQSDAHQRRLRGGAARTRSSSWRTWPSTPTRSTRPAPSRRASAPRRELGEVKDPVDIARVRAALQTALMRERIATRRRSRG